MEKLTHTIPNLRVTENTHKGITKMAQLDKRRATDYIRLLLDKIVENYEKTGVLPDL